MHPSRELLFLNVILQVVEKSSWMLQDEAIRQAVSFKPQLLRQQGVIKLKPQPLPSYHSESSSSARTSARKGTSFKPSSHTPTRW